MAADIGEAIHNYMRLSQSMKGMDVFQNGFWI